MIEIKKLSEKDIPQVILLSLNIFNPPEGGKDYYHFKDRWIEYFRQNGLLFGAYVDEELAGYVFFYDRDKGAKASHCWMAGVSEKFRRKGLLKSLMDKAKRSLKNMNYKQMTINTYPEKFRAMYSYLTKYQYSIYKEEQKEWDGQLTKKCFFREDL